jgi:hypothetical protein
VSPGLCTVDAATKSYSPVDKQLKTNKFIGIDAHPVPESNGIVPAGTLINEGQGNEIL